MPKIITSIFFNNIKIDNPDNILLRDLIIKDENVVLCCKHQNQVYSVVACKSYILVVLIQDKPQVVSGYEQSMTRLAIQTLRRLQNKQSKQRIVSETIKWAYHWLKNHDMKKLPYYSQTASRKFLECSSAYDQQTLTQMFDPNNNPNDLYQISQLDSLNSQTIQHCILNSKKKLSKLSKKQNQKIKRKKRPSPYINLQFKQTKLSWKAQDIIVRRSKTTHCQQSTKNKKSTTSKWDKYLSKSQLREKYNIPSKSSVNIFSNQRISGTEFNDFLIQDVHSTQICHKRHSIPATDINKPMRKKQKL